MFNKWVWEMSAIETPWGVDWVPQNKERQLSLSKGVCLSLTCVPLILYSPIPLPSPHLWAGHSLDSSGVRALEELSSSPQSCPLLRCLGT